MNNAKTLTSAEKKDLSAKAHSLKPVVSIGSKGLTPAVLNELEIAFKAHGLIKVKIGSDKAGREEIFANILYTAQRLSLALGYLGFNAITFSNNSFASLKFFFCVSKPAK